ncbi:MAG: SulP family inorganic anion transporter, partial [Oleibacter sp.]|nr:SulP family inorganic anion transporter [Thalassolituus sp.]
MALIIYLESLAIANALARKNHQRISANQELLALGAANIAAAATQAMPVAGSFGRSVVSEHSGAKSQWASVWSALLIVLVCLFASHLFYYVPEAVLGAIISVSAWSLLNWRDGWRAWLYQRSDGAIWLTTFLLVLIRDAETGILAGVALSLVLYLRRTSKPHIAEVGVLQDSGEIRNVLRHKVHTVPGILMIRPDESLYFGNSDFLVDAVLKRVNNDKSITHVLLIGSAINHIDFSGFEALENLSQDLTKRNIYFHLAEFKGPVMDQLEKTDLLRNFSSGKVFFSVREAIHELSHSISPQSTINKYPSDDFYSI